MSRQKKSKTSSRLRLGKFEFPEKTPIWFGWKSKEIHDVEYGGLKFKAAFDGHSIRVGQKMEYGQFGLVGANSLSLTRMPESIGADLNSCAYQRIYPYGADRDMLIMWAWWLENYAINRGTVAYLTKKDGDVESIKQVLNRRGFRTVCVTKSKHTGNYPVYLLAHPGDAALREKKNKNKKVENADLLGSADANVPQLGGIGNPVGGDQPATFVQDAFTLAA